MNKEKTETIIFLSADKKGHIAWQCPKRKLYANVNAKETQMWVKNEWWF